ncbi:MAG: DUF1501 domain-containing protein [Verrucomicrobiia bacterium]|jgi:hypothetical protein
MISERANQISRRRFFDSVQDGVHGMALAWLLKGDLFANEAKKHSPPAMPSLDLLPKPPHFPAKAKTVIHLCMQGGPSQVDLFDPKTELDKYHGKDVPQRILDGTFQVRSAKLMRSRWAFEKRGQSGMDVSELLPHMSGVIDEFAMIRSMYNVHPNHEPAIYKMQTGKIFPGHPTFGSWITYGLGTVNQNLPAYVVLADSRLPVNAVENWMSGYLPPLYQGTRMRMTGSPMLNLKPEYQEPESITAAKRELLASLDQMHKQERPFRPELDSRIRNYELAARMQLTATDALDVTKESAETKDLYGLNDKVTESFGRRCLLARRLAERGVRFIQLYTRSQMWDNHGNIKSSLPAACIHTDRGVAALIRDLRQRGMLDSTLILWGGEFGRLPMAQAKNQSQLDSAGRDHGPWGFTTLLAGAGVKAGTVYGATDEFGFAATENRVSTQDWHATILHLLGMDHQKLIVDRNGLFEKLTHTFQSRVVREVLA